MALPTTSPLAWRFALPWVMAGGVAVGVRGDPVQTLLAIACAQVVFALLERVPALSRSPAATTASTWHRVCLRVHLLWQAAALAAGVVVSVRAAAGGWDGAALGQVLAAAVAVGWVTGSLGITFAHELGHSRSRVDRLIAWLLMGSVLYSHFMVEHYRGHHRLAATREDPATARRGESLWQFLPRTLGGSWTSAWRLESERLRRHGRAWSLSPLAWAMMIQAVGLLALGVAAGAAALLFWIVQAAVAVFLLETINYIEHYGLERLAHDGRPEPFAQAHAWNADAALTNSLLANLQRHSDHHLHPWKPYETLQPLPGPQLPTGYAGCVMLALVPRWWFAIVDPRLPSRPQAS